MRNKYKYVDLQDVVIPQLSIKNEIKVNSVFLQWLIDEDYDCVVSGSETSKRL